MKVRFVTVAALILVCAAVSSVGASTPMRVMGSGEDMEIDPASVPAHLREGYAIMERTCLACHGEERFLELVKDCREQKNSSRSYCEQEVRQAVGHNLRRPGVDLDREDTRKLFEFFEQVLDIRFPGAVPHKK